MTLSVETLGQDNIKTLQNAVANLAKEGGDAAPEFQQLADEIGRIGEQAQAIAAFKDLAMQTDALATKQQEAAAKVGELAGKLQLAGQATDAAAAKQRAASAALLEARQIYDGATSGIKNLNAEYDAAGRKTDDYRGKLITLTQQQGEQRDKFAELRSELKQANAALSETEGAQSKLTTQHTRADAALAKVTTALHAHNGAVTESAQAAEKLGTSTENLATSEAQLLQSLNASRTAALARSAASKEMEESDRLLAIQAKGMAELYERGRVALLAEEAGLREAARASINYKAAREAEEQARIAAAASWQKEAFAIVEASLAAQKLKREVDLLAASERELANTKAFTQQAEDAKKLQQAGEYVKFWESELSKVESQLNATTAASKETSTAAEKSAQSIANAFRTVGVKSAQELEAEIVQVRLAMDELKNKAGLTGSTLSTAFAAGESKINGLERQLREVNGTLTMGDKAAKLFSNSLGQISAGNVIADGVGYLVNKVKELGAAFLGAIVQGDQLKRGLNAVYKDAAITAQQIDFLRKASSESGVAFGSLSGEFVKFTASMKMANIPMAQSNDLFRAVTAASASLGLGAEATAGTLNALGQMASKGTVSLEELRAQLGDRLPGALGLTAQGLGITEGQLIKLVESGQLATRDFVVPFTKALGQLKGEVDGLVPSWERLKGSLTQTAQSMGDAGWTALLTTGLQSLAMVAGLVVVPLSALFELIFGIAKAGGILAASVVTWTSPWQALGDVLDAAAKRQSDLTESFNAAAGGSEKAGQAAATHAGAITTSTAAVTKSIAANTQLDIAQKLAALSAALAADSTLDAAAKIVQYNAAASELLKSQAGQTDAFNKLAKAAKDQGATLVENAKLTGDNTAVQVAGLQAAQLYAVAIDKAAASQALETDALVAQKAELEKSAAARGLTALQIKTQTDDLDKLILASKAETEQSIQAQAAARAEVEGRKLAVAALADNSSKVDAYRAAVAAAQKEVDRLTVVENAGLGVKGQLTAAQEQLAHATFMYRDAVTDLITKTGMKAKLDDANLQLSIAQADASGKHYMALAAEARALGDTALATHYEIRAKEEQIKMMQLKLQLDKLQQDAALLEIDLKRKLIDGNTEEGKVKLQLLDIETQMIKIKQVGNQAAQDAIRAVEKETDALRTGINVRNQSTAGVNTDTGARNVNTSAIQKQNDALLAQQQRLKALGDIATAEYNAPHNVLLRKKAEGTLESGDLVDAENTFKAAKNNLTTLQQTVGADPSGLQDAMTMYNQARDTLERVRGLANSGSSSTATPAAQTTATTTPAKTYTVNVNLGGTNTAINTSSDADAQALIRLLQSAKLSSGL